MAIAIVKLPEADHLMLGNQGLLDIAINSGNAAEMVKQLKNIDISSYAKMTEEVAATLQEKGFNVVTITDQIDVEKLEDFEPSSEKEGVYYASKDYRKLKDELKADRLLLVQVMTVGTERSYYGFIPTSPPAAQASVRMQIIDLNNARLLWRDNLKEVVAVQDPWDQPPSFPNVTAAVEKVVLMTRKITSQRISQEFAAK
jgi:hypothetical protein